MKALTKQIVSYAVVFAVVIAITIPLYFLVRKINYAISYDTMVRETITKMVKPEALKQLN